jgi:hypothetical protein
MRCSGWRVGRRGGGSDASRVEDHEQGILVASTRIADIIGFTFYDCLAMASAAAAPEGVVTEFSSVSNPDYGLCGAKTVVFAEYGRPKPAGMNKPGTA